MGLRKPSEEIENILLSEQAQNHKKALKEFFVTLGGSNDTKKLKELKKDLEEFLELYEDMQIQNTLYVIDAYLGFIANGDKAAAYNILVPMLESLNFGLLATSVYDVKLLCASLLFIPHYIRTARIADILVDILIEDYTGYPEQEKTLASVYTNVLSRLLDAKYFEKGTEEEYLQSLDEKIRNKEKGYADIDEQFVKHSRNALKLCIEYDWFKLYAINLITNGIFYKDEIRQDDGLVIAKLLPNEPWLYEFMVERIKKYNLLDIKKG